MGKKKSEGEKKCNFGLHNEKAEGIWTAATVASRQNIDGRYQMPGELRSTKRATLI